MKTVGWLLLVWVLALPQLGCSGEDRMSSGIAAAEPDEDRERVAAPDFTLKDVNGKNVRLSDFRGKTLVIDFWATWCPPCVFQVPELNALYEAHLETGDVAVVGVSVDVDGVEVVGPWVKEQGVKYPILMGDEDLARKFGVLGFPTLVLITPSGEIDSLHVGLIEAKELEELVAPLVAKAS